MGQQNSRFSAALPSASGAATDDSAAPINLSDHVSLTPPNAAVIGAGVAGVHVAYELAKLGFQVTVFERRNDIAAGETQFSLPFVGVGLVEPALVRASLRAEAMRGMLFPTTCPDLIAREHLFHTVMNPVVYRWIWGRVRSCFTDKEVMCYTNNLSRVSHTVVRDLVSKYPQLQQHVSAGPVTVLNNKREPVATAHGEPLMVDPVGWTRALADVCRTHYGVEFALNVQLEDTNTYLKYDVESMKSIRVSKPDPVVPEQRVFASERYDVVVFAAGANTGTVTLPNARLPILGLSGLTAVLQQPSGSLRDALWSLFQPASKQQQQQQSQAEHDGTGLSAASSSASLSRPSSGTLALLSPRCSLYGYTRPSRPATTATAAAEGVSSLVQSKVMPPGQEYVLQGLLSLDTIVKPRVDAVVATQLSRLESYIRIKCGQVVPLETSSPAAAQEHGEAAEPTRDNTIEVQEYVRGFTPDGVPLVDHNGGAFNCFVCSGFGDHAMDFAPGAAKVLGKLVEHQAQRLREQDLENVKTWGLLTSQLTPSRRTEVEGELQQLFNGIVPGDAGAATKQGPKASSSSAPAEAPLLRFEMNPFSTNRFTGLVRKEIKDTTSLSWLEQFYRFENRLIVRSEPYRIAFHHKMMDYAERDGVPASIRNIVFMYLFDERDDPESVQKRQEFKEGVQRLVNTYERPKAAAAGAEDTAASTASNAALTPAERSKRREAELERQARELFSKP